jgi:Lipocalin-like domain
MDIADGNPLPGTWKLKSYVATTDAGDKSTPYGRHPNGYISYSRDGRMQVIGTSDERIAPHEYTTSTFRGTTFGPAPIKFDSMR